MRGHDTRRARCVGEAGGAKRLFSSRSAPVPPTRFTRASVARGTATWVTGQGEGGRGSGCGAALAAQNVDAGDGAPAWALVLSLSLSGSGRVQGWSR